MTLDNLFHLWLMNHSGVLFLVSTIHSKLMLKETMKLESRSKRQKLYKEIELIITNG